MYRRRWIAVVAAVYALICVVVPVFVRPMPTVPVDSMFGGSRGGCGNLTAYRFSEDRHMAIVFDLNDYKVENGIVQTFSVGPPKGQSAIHVYELASRDYRFCDDVLPRDPPKYTWKATAGNAEVRYLRDGNTATGSFYVRVRLRDVNLTNTKTGAMAHLKSVDIEEVMVGWLSG